MIDIVLPQNNEKEFTQMAEKLGYNTLIFLYKTEKEIKQTTSNQIKIKPGIITTNGGKGKHLTFLQSGEKDQQIIENNPTNAFFGFESKAEKDYIHQRASGLNNIMCELARKNDVLVCFSFNQLLKSYKTKSKLNIVQQDTTMVRAQILGRMMQNIKLCRKHNVKTAIASFATTPYEMRAPKDLQAMFQVLGMHLEDARKAIDSVS